MALLKANEVKTKLSKVTLSRGIPLKYKDTELMYPTVYMREAGMDDIIAIPDIKDKDIEVAVGSLAKFLVVIAGEGYKWTGEDVEEDKREYLYPMDDIVLTIPPENLKKRETKPKDFKRLSKAFMAINELEEEELSDFFTYTKVLGTKKDED